MNILLINPPSNPKVIYSGDDSMYPYSLLFLSSYLYSNGYRSKILDLSTSSNTVGELSDYIYGRKIDIIGFTATTANRFLVWDMIKSSRKLLPDVKIIVGGKFFTYTSEETLNNIPEIDIVVRQEGEITLLELVKCYEAEKDICDVQGITYSSAEGIISNPLRQVEMDLDKLNIRDEVIQDIILPHGDYSPFIIMRNYENERMKALPIHVGRGCPGKCVFCLCNKIPYRTRSVSAIIEEIKEKKKKYNCSVFHLQDPFLLKRSGFAKELSRKLIEENINIQFYIETRADIDLDLIEIMKEAGCISLDFGLETASQRVLDAIRKGIKAEMAQKLIEKCSEIGIRIKVFSMISMPDEREEDALETIRFLEKHKKNITNYGGAVTCIFPGTELESMAKQRGILAEDFSWYDRNYVNVFPGSKIEHIPIWLEHLSTDFIKYCQKRINRIKFSKVPVIIKVFEKIIPFMFDWSVKGIKKKLLWMKLVFRSVAAKVSIKLTGK